jgi:phage host-nuclease inhibitor protein Gam
MTSRIKAPSLKTREAFLDAVNECAILQTERRKLTAARDAKIQDIQDRFADEIEDLDRRIKERVALAEKFAESHRDELFPRQAKSASSGLATYGFRLGQPTLVLLNRRWSWEHVIDAIKSSFPKRFVRVKETVDKDALKAELDEAQLASVGCRIQQTDTFYIEPTVEGAEAIKSEVVA